MNLSFTHAAKRQFISDARWGTRSGSFGRARKKPSIPIFESHARHFLGGKLESAEREFLEVRTRRNIPFRDQIRRQRYGLRLTVFVLIRNLLNRGQVRTSYFTSEQRSRRPRGRDVASKGEQSYSLCHPTVKAPLQGLKISVMPLVDQSPRMTFVRLQSDRSSH